jgi:2-dehydropantoate 2-reductase
MFGKFVVRPDATTSLKADPDVLFVTTKATSLDQALKSIDASSLDKAVVIPLLNGLEHVELLRRQLGNRVAAGSIRIESRSERPGRIVHSSPFIKIRIASDRDIARERLNDIAEFLCCSGIATTVGESEANVLWEKLVRLVALACTTALSNQPIGFVRKDPYWRGLLERVVKEAVTVASAYGVVMDASEQIKILDGLPELLTSSLQRDIAAGRPSELDAIAGAVLRAGESKDLSLSCLREMTNQLQHKVAEKEELHD